ALVQAEGALHSLSLEVLLARLVEAIKKKEEMIDSPKDWVSTQAKNQQALQEGGTLRHTLWRHLQCVVTPFLANIFEVMDRFANLDLLAEGKLSPGLEKLWLNILADSQILVLTVSQKSSEADQEVLVLDGEEHHCAAPFSWLVTLHLESLWEESEFIPEGDEGRILQFVSLFNNSRLGHLFQTLSAEDRIEYGRNYLQDFLLLSLKIKSKDKLMVFFRAMLGCVSELQASLGVISDLSPAWIMAAARRFDPRLDTLNHVLLLQPQLAADIRRQWSQTEPNEMTEDILALGVCIEQTKLLTVTSLQECERFVSRVEFLQPCLERAFSQKYSSLCSPGCSQELGSIRSLWHGILMVASFIQHIIFKLKQSDSRLKKAGLKHCSILLHLMRESPDVKSAVTLEQLIRILNSLHDECISGELRFGISCTVCLEELTEPSVLPCQHVTCLTCLQRCLVWRHSCPVCRVALPPTFQPTVSPTIKAALQQQSDVRGYCNGFFLEVVSRFCLSEGQQPAEGVVELLFSLLVFASGLWCHAGDTYRTRELTPFLECMDNSPVVRSVLPKLLMQYSFDQVKVYIQTYLKNLEENLLSPEDSTQLHLLFVSCFQDSLLCSEARELESKDQYRKAEIHFLSRMARKQTPDRREEPAEFLLNTAKLRICLSSAALQLKKAADQGKDDVDIQYMQQVKAVCEYSGNDWYRIYLLRAVYRLSGVDCVLYLMNNPSWSWVFPPDLLRLQVTEERMCPEKMDRFLCCGTSYQGVRHAVTRFILETRTEDMVTEMKTLNCKKLRGSQVSLLALALFRQVTCRYKSCDADRLLSQQETTRLEELLQGICLVDYRDFCAALLSNQVGGAGSSLRVVQGLSIQRQTLLELLVHLGSVLLTGNHLLTPLRNIAFQPHTVTNFFLPTMADDHTSKARGWLGSENVRMYYCAKGHACFVGECGRPVVVSRCPDCGNPIGGINHNPVQGFSQTTSGEDQTRTGHILGEAAQRSDAAERQMTCAQTCILRLLTHLAMLLGSIKDQRSVGDMIHPRCSDVSSFLWSHLEKDIHVLGEALGQNLDNTAIAVHLILRICADSECRSGSRDGGLNLSTPQSRQEWERLVCDSAISPVLHNLQQKLAEAQRRITADDGLVGSPVMKTLLGDPASMLSLPAGCPTHCSSFWNLPENVTVKSFSQLVEQSPDHSSLDLLITFLQKINCVKQLHHLPELAALQSDLLRIGSLISDCRAQSIAQVLQNIPAGCQKKMLVGRVERFITVWNSLRADVANNAADLGVEVWLCEMEMTKESCGEFLAPSRHGPGSCLRILVELLLKTQNSLVREARTLRGQDDREYVVPLERVSESQLVLCHPERELLPLVLSHCHYTLKKGGETHSSYDLPAIQMQLVRRYLAGKPLIKELQGTERYLNRHLQDFSVVLAEVRGNIRQAPLKGSVCAAVRTVLRSYTDVCDAIFVLEIGLRFLAKTGGDPQGHLLSFLTESLQLDSQISSTVAKSLGESRLKHSVFTWQLLTCWRSELMLKRKQEPFQRLPSQFQQKLSEVERRGLRQFLAVTDVDAFALELHEVLLLKTSNAVPEEGYQAHWDIRSTLENHLDQKELPPLLGLEVLPEEITLGQGPDVWRAAMEFKRR
uniref:Uncharacterized protein n=1 Tax=Tetraodon nigroviridis TaxID=99883 RepID=H3D2U7_TETNG